MNAGRTRLLLMTAACAAIGLACARSDVTVGTSLPTVAGPTQTPVENLPTVAPTEAPTAMPSHSPTPDRPAVPVSPTPPPTPTQANGGDPETILYQVQPGDTVRGISVRFGVLESEITAAESSLPAPNALLDQDTLLLIPRRLGPTGPADRLLPDSEFVFSPHAAEFDVVGFVESQPGYLRDYQEFVYGQWHGGGEVVALAARDSSVNPRILLAMLEYEAGWVTDPERPVGREFTYPLGHESGDSMGLFRQLTWLANKMGEGYYAWRAGALTEIEFQDNNLVRIAPDLNAGTVAVQTFFATRLQGRDWARAVSPDGMIAVYQQFFGDPWEYEHPLMEPGVQQPDLVLPFTQGHTWAFTGGPHGAWEREAAWAALDFAPRSVEPGCVRSNEWIVAAAPGLVLRSGNGVVVLDLDGDGREQTGWVLIYLHVDDVGRVEAGSFVETDDLIGHPSCEGGIATGTHLHLTRKYNGEWVLADGPLPFDLSGWQAVAGTEPYQGALIKDGEQVLACPCGSSETLIQR